MCRFAAVAGAGALLLASLAGVEGASAAGSISWGKCQDSDLRKAGGQCGSPEVPLDWRDPGGEKVSIAVSRIKATKGPRQGVMLGEADGFDQDGRRTGGDHRAGTARPTATVGSQRTHGGESSTLGGSLATVSPCPRFPGPSG